MSDTNNFSIRGANDFGQDDADRNQNHNHSRNLTSDEKHHSSSSSSSNPYIPTHAATDFYHNANPGGPTTNSDANQARRTRNSGVDRKGGSQADKEGEGGKKSIAGKIKEYIKPAKD